MHRTYADSVAQDEFLEIAESLFQISKRSFCTQKKKFVLFFPPKKKCINDREM